MGVVQCLGHGRHQCRRFRKRGPIFLDPFCQRAACDELRHDEADELRGAADIVDRDDMRMIEIGNVLRFHHVGEGIFGLANQLAVGTLMATGRFN